MQKNGVIMLKNYGKVSVIAMIMATAILGILAFIGWPFDTKKGNSGGFTSDRAPSFNLNALQNKQNLVSIAIIGSGPAGMMAGVYGSRALRDTLIFEGDKPGGLLMDTTDVENWPGEKAIHGPDIMKKLRYQAQKLGTLFVQEAVETVDFSQWPYLLVTDNGTQFYALTVIIATGATPKRLGVPGEEENWGTGVSACAVCDAPFFKGKDVMVVGGGDSAVEEAIQLAPYVNTVTIVVRKESMRQQHVCKSGLKIMVMYRLMYNSEITEIFNNDKGFVTSVAVYNNRDQKISTVPIDGVFLAIGHNPNTEIFKDQIAMDKEGHILVHNRTQKTSLDGVFAAGDVEDTMYRQAGVAAASGIKAALDADQFLGSIGVTNQHVDTLQEQFYIFNNKNSLYDIAEIATLEDLEPYKADAKTLLLLFFYSEACSSSIQMLPIFQEFAQENGGQYNFGTVNTNKASYELINHFFVPKVPTLILVKNGILVGRCNGLMSKHQIKEYIDSL